MIERRANPRVHILIEILAAVVFIAVLIAAGWLINDIAHLIEGRV